MTKILHMFQENFLDIIFFSFNTLVLVSEKLIIIGLENSIVTVLSITKILHIFQQALLKSTGF